MSTSSFAHDGMFHRIGQSSRNGRGELLVWHNAAGLAVADDSARPAVRSHDCRNAAGQRLQYHVAEGIRMRWKHKEVHVSVGSRQLFALQHARKLRARQAPPQPRLLGAVTDNEKAEALVSC